MHYLHVTAQLPLTLEADNLQAFKWWVDGEFATHLDMRSHTGRGVYSLVKGQFMGP